LQENDLSESLPVISEQFLLPRITRKSFTPDISDDSQKTRYEFGSSGVNEIVGARNFCITKRSFMDGKILKGECIPIKELRIPWYKNLNLWDPSLTPSPIKPHTRKLRASKVSPPGFLRRTKTQK
jgi:hypothetical protein